MTLFEAAAKTTPAPPKPPRVQQLVGGKHTLRLERFLQRFTRVGKFGLVAEFSVVESETLEPGTPIGHVWFFTLSTRDDEEITDDAGVRMLGGFADQLTAAQCKRFAKEVFRSLCLVLSDDDQSLPDAPDFIVALTKLTEEEEEKKYPGHALLEVDVKMRETKRGPFPIPTWTGIRTEENLDIAIGYAEMKAFELLAAGDEDGSAQWMKIARQREREMRA